MKAFSVAAFATCLAATNGLGINCKGSLQCDFIGAGHAKELVNAINGIDPNRRYANGELIACAGILCAFLQNTGGAFGFNIKGLAPRITEHNCGNCGSVPFFFPSDNDVSHGQLTFNVVTHPCPDGLC